MHSSTSRGRLHVEQNIPRPGLSLSRRGLYHQSPDIFIPPPSPPYLVGAKPVSLLVGLNREAVVEQEPVVALLAIAVVHLSPPANGVQRRDRERSALIVVSPLSLPRPARRNKKKRNEKMVKNVQKCKNMPKTSKTQKDVHKHAETPRTNNLTKTNKAFRNTPKTWKNTQKVRGYTEVYEAVLLCCY